MIERQKFLKLSASEFRVRGKTHKEEKPQRLVCPQNLHSLQHSRVQEELPLLKPHCWTVAVSSSTWEEAALSKQQRRSASRGRFEFSKWWV